LPAVNQDAATGWSDIDEQHRIIEQAGKKARLQIAEQTKVLHGVSPLFLFMEL
jgi:hypothetical protein